jgi:serine/threonine-protein kinase
MGEVWRARDPRLGRDVAIKVIPDEMSQDADRVARFRAEARAASALNHPNIVTIYDIGDDDGRTYLSMELLEGVSLRQLIDSGRLPLSKALQVAAQMADGLAAAHVRGIVHRDLKPENVFLTADNVVKILDFGLAKLSPLASANADEPTMSLSAGTQPGTVLGTIGYRAPEQAAGKMVDFRADQFSFGTIVYELVSGRRAWRKATPAETIVAILREDAPPLSSPESPVPAPVLHFVGRCLAKTPDDRYSSTRDMARDVKYLAEQTSAPKGLADLDLSVEAPARPRRRIPVRAAVGTSVFAAAAVLGAFLWVRARPGPDAIASLAVLPFENGTRDPDSEYLSDGVTESLIDQMSRVPSLRVMARATVFRFKGSTDPQEAGRKLGVAAVVTGKISRRTDRLSISAELVDVRSGTRLWGDTYDRPAGDLLRVQSQIASDISSGLRLRLTEPEKRALSEHGTENAEAYELYLKGRFFINKATEDGYLEAARLFAQAAQKDPGFADAWSWAGSVYGVMAFDGYMPPREASARQDEHVRKALALSPRLASARFQIAGRRWFYDWDWAGGERDFREVFAETGSSATLDFRPFALMLWSRGGTEEALALMEKARRVDPGNLAYTVAAADYLKKAGNLDEAAALYRSAMEADPSDPRALYGMAEILRKKGDVPAAIDALRKAYELSDESDGIKALAAARTEKDYESAQVAVARARLAEFEALAKERYVSPLDIARFAAQAGEREKAFSYLEKAFAERSGGLTLLKVDTAWDSVRDDARFGALVRRVGIP